jgi:hypothetical protein
LDEKRRIVLGEEDFADTASPPPPAAPQQTYAAPEAQQLKPPGPALPSVTRGVPRHVEPEAHPGSAPAAAKSTPNSLTDARTAPLVAAAIGILAGWAITELTGINKITATSRLGLDATEGLWVAVVGLVFGGTVLAYDSAVGGAWTAARNQFAKAALPMFGASFAAGFLAQVVYGQIIKSILEEVLRGQTTVSQNDVRLYLARALGWALFGIGVGVTVGLIRKSNRLALNGGIGGAIGGAIGGIIFEYLGVNGGLSESLTRLVGLAAVGGLIAVATRVIETARRQAWLHIVAGGMAGKEFILYHAVTRIGASPDCEIFLLKDPAIAKLHAQIHEQDGHRTLTAMPSAPVFVNQQPVQSHVLRNGDQLQIGNTVISYSERADSAA